MRIHKHPLAINAEATSHEELAELTETTLEVPQGAQLLSVEMSASGPAVFLLVDEDAPLEERTFATVGNGVELPEGVDALHFRGTAKVPGGPTWHVFETTAVAV